MRKQALVFVFSILLIGIFGCRREMNLASWDTDLLAPAAHGSINFYNYLPEENFVEESGNLIHFVAEDTLISLGLDTLIGIPDYSIDTGFFFPLSIPLQPGQPFIVDTSETTFDLKDVRLTEAIIRNSRIRVDIRNTLDQDVLFQYSIESASIDGDTFRVSERIDGNSSFSKEYDLNGYTLNLRGLKQNKVNTVATTIVAMVHPDLVGTQQLKAGDRFDISNTVTNVIPEYVTGYFGNQVAEFNESEGLESEPLTKKFDVSDKATHIKLIETHGFADKSLLRIATCCPDATKRILSAFKKSDLTQLVEWSVTKTAGEMDAASESETVPKRIEESSPEGLPGEVIVRAPCLVA